ncbi:cytochrome P450 [Zopfia rhizophila CBS 207.26]|uniref:Cytochrome P450 n=1 Tax=Zopfia rhizophila CBS 207.26 TaxID=1314779 RepID=A0A6A6DGW8_9PEZI|nr:cytochrome P450 [Zopfia rhizophila CBS 207.26]
MEGVEIRESIAAFAFFLILLDKLLGIKKDVSEPPFIPMSVPYFGHLMGVMGGKISYYARLSRQYGYKIYSLAMPGGRIYIVNSPDLISTIQKHPRVLSFWFIEASLTKNLGGISNKANSLLLENAQGGQQGDKGENSLVVDGMKVRHKAMSCDHLDKMTLAAIERAKKEIYLPANTTKEVELWDWVQHMFSLAVCSSVYGPDNPYEDQNLERGLSEFADHTPTFLTGLPQWLFVPKAYAAREAIVARFQDYFAAKSDQHGSELVKVKAEVLRQYGVTEGDIARFEAVNGFGILLNLLPTAFWTIHHIFSDPEALETVRKEAMSALLLEHEDALPSSVAGLTKLERLPTLTSTMKESLRFHASGAAARMVMEDRMLNGQFLLKRNSYVFIPNKSIHFDRDRQGDSVDQFIASRFGRQNGVKMHPAAFRGFGGGVKLRPGRVFSTNPIDALKIIA